MYISNALNKAIPRKPPLNPAMFSTILSEELRNAIRAKSTWICFGVLLLVALRDLLSGYWDDLIGAGRIARNSPYSAYYVAMFSNWWGMMIATGLATLPVLRDIRGGFARLFYAGPFQDRSYLWAKYISALFRVTFVLTGYHLGILLLPLIGPWFMPEGYFMATPWGQWFHAWAIYILPAAFTYASLHFALIALTGRTVWNWIVTVGIFSVFLIVNILFEDSSGAPVWVQFIDPLQKTTLEQQMFTWSAEQRMTEYVTVTGTILWNKLLYIALGVIPLLWVALRFDRCHLLGKMRGADKGAKRGKHLPAAATGALAPLATVNGPTRWWQSWCIAVLDFRQVGKSLLIRVLGSLTLLMATMSGFGLYGVGATGETMELPFTSVVLHRTTEFFYLPACLTLAFIAGDILYRERGSRAHLLVDPLPIPTLTFFGGKMLAILGWCGVLAVVPSLITVVCQLILGAPRIEWVLLLHHTTMIDFPAMVANAGLIVVAQVVSRGRMLGNIISATVIISLVIFHEILTLEHDLLLYSLIVHGWDWTEFAGYERNAIAYVHFAGYYISVALLLFALGLVLWRRGVLPRTWWNGSRIGRTTGFALAGIAAIASASVWAAFHNMNVRNDFHTREDEIVERIEYERYLRKTLLGVAQPAIAGADVTVQLDPAAPRVDLEATFTLRNPHAEPIATLHANLHEDAPLMAAKQGDAVLEITRPLDHGHGHGADFAEITLATPIPAGGETKVTFTHRVAPTGYSHHGYNTTLLADGSVITSDWLPRFGYDRGEEETLPGNRVRHGLPAERSPVVAPGTPAFALGRTTGGIGEGGPLTLRVQSAESLQIVATGVEEGDSGVFHNASAADHWAITAANYKTLTAASAAGTEVRAYAPATFAPNHERILDDATAALDFLEAQYGAHPDGLIQIAAAPAGLIDPIHAGNLVILPAKEVWFDHGGYGEVDWVAYHTARHLSRLWWDNGLRPAEAPGYPLFTEALPALDAKHFIQLRNGTKDVLAELVDHRTLTYLRDSAIEPGTEPPADQLTDEDYAPEKAFLALNSVAAATGYAETAELLSRYFLEASDAPDPVTAADLRTFFQREVPSDRRDRVMAALGEVRTHDNQLRAATAAPNTNGEGWVVTLTLFGSRFAPIGSDNRTEMPFGDTTHVLLTDETGEQQHLAAVEFSADETEVSIPVSFIPARAVLDPNREMIDRDHADNTRAVTVTLEGNLAASD